jgi:hypothetical protein
LFSASLAAAAETPLSAWTGDRRPRRCCAGISLVLVTAGHPEAFLMLSPSFPYTISLSAFYLARANAIQLLQPQDGNATWYHIEHLEKLLDKLSPDAISIDSVKSPTDQAVDLATTWIKQKGK